jgi:hypothetical protein
VTVITTSEGSTIKPGSKGETLAGYGAKYEARAQVVTATRESGPRPFWVRAPFSNGLPLEGEISGGTRTGERGPQGSPPLSLSNGHKCAKPHLGIKLSGSQRKTAHAIRHNVETMIAEDGLSSTGFLTLTVGDSGPDGFEMVLNSGEASKRVHRLMRRFIGHIFRRGVIVTERHKSGAIHFHLVGSLVGREDIRAGFDFDAVKRGDYRSASPALRAIWKKLREELPSFGFGRSELLPVRKTGAEVGSYVSKYIEKNIGQRTEDDKGKKLVRYFGWNKRQLKPNDFGWATPQAAKWRASARMLSALVGVVERTECADCFGPRWAFRLNRVMNAVPDLAELEDFARRSTARQLVQMEASHRWIDRRSRQNMRDPAAFRWKWIYRTPSERAQRILNIQN